MAEEEAEREEGVHASGSGEVREEVGVVALSTTSGDRSVSFSIASLLTSLIALFFLGRKFHLVICQQPEIGASAGPERITLGRASPLPASSCSASSNPSLTSSFPFHSFLSSPHP